MVQVEPYPGWTPGARTLPRAASQDLSFLSFGGVAVSGVEGESFVGNGRELGGDVRFGSSRANHTDEFQQWFLGGPLTLMAITWREGDVAPARAGFLLNNVKTRSTTESFSQGILHPGLEGRRDGKKWGR